MQHWIDLFCLQLFIIILNCLHFRLTASFFLMLLSTSHKDIYSSTVNIKTDVAEATEDTIKWGS